MDVDLSMYVYRVVLLLQGGMVSSHTIIINKYDLYDVNNNDYTQTNFITPIIIHII